MVRGADWVATKDMIQQQYPWVHFMHCVAHEGSLMIKDICKISEIADLLEWLADAQKWFTTNKLGPLLQRFCREHYLTTRAFINPSETRFAGKLLQIKRFLSMKSALQQLVKSSQYQRFNFLEDVFIDKISGTDVWELMSAVCKTAGPILLLIRLADSHGGTLSKLKGTVDYIKSQLIDTGAGRIQDDIAAAFHNRAPELDSDIASAAYVLDPQFLDQSRHASSTVMSSFWQISRNVLRINDNADWKTVRSKLAHELAKFRMKTGGFACENYQTTDPCSFWSVAGCHAPTLKTVALRLTSLPCSSGEAERNWKEFKLNLTKTRNRLDKDKVQQMIFVRRFLRLKRSLCTNEKDTGFAGWVADLLTNASSSGSGDAVVSSADEDTQKIFMDVIEAGEQGRINGREPGAPVVSLTALKRDNASKSWLFEKCYDVCFVDKNPEGDEQAPPLTDQSQWEYRIIKDVVWWRAQGYAVETQLRGGVANQSVIKYHINRALLQMIRDSPHNTRPMFTVNNNDDNSDGDNSVHSEPLDLDHDLDHDSDTNTDDDSSDDKPLSAVLTDIRKSNTRN